MCLWRTNGFIELAEVKDDLHPHNLHMLKDTATKKY